MDNKLTEFPSDRFAITAYCQCGHSAPIDYRLLPPETLVNGLMPRLVCKVWGRREPGYVSTGRVPVGSNLLRSDSMATGARFNDDTRAIHSDD